MKHRTSLSRYTLLPALVFLVLAGVAGCGFMFDEGGSGGSGSTDAGLGLVWPDGYSYNADTGQIIVPSNAKSAVAPTYVTGINLVISGDDMETLYIDVPLDTLFVSVTLTLGVRRFDVTVKTDRALTFTGSLVKDITLQTNSITITVNVNAPPEIYNIWIDHNPANGADYLYCDAFDPDGDQLTYSWTGPGGWSSTEQYATYTAFASGEFICTVVDGMGGSDRKSVWGDFAPPFKIISVTGRYDNTTNDTYLFCEVDNTNNLTLHFEWIGPGGWTAYVQYPVYQGSATGVFTCIVNDDFGNKDSMDLSFAGAPPASAPGGLTATPSSTVNGQIDINWTTVTDASWYNLYWNQGTGGVTLASSVTGGIVSPVYAFSCPVSQIYYFNMTAANSSGESALGATEVGSVTCPGIVQVIGVTFVDNSPSVGDVTVSWTPSTGAISYTVYWDTNSTVSPTSFLSSSTVTPTSFVHPVGASPGCTTGTTYWYTITGTDGTFVSTPSATLSHTCP